MERRTILKLVAAGVLPGSSGLVQIACSEGGYAPEFFSRSEMELLDMLAELILPSDDHSPGAREAGVARYIDVIVADSSNPDQQRWRSGLRAVSSLAQDRFNEGFAGCSLEQQDQIMADLARNEDDPETDAQRFFVRIKRATIAGYYTSKVGIDQELGYKGNTAIDEFLGCQHEDHGEGGPSPRALIPDAWRRATAGQAGLPH